MSSGHVTRVRKLFKLILRLHRNLPDDLRVLGDNYAREEFKRHKNCKPQEAHIFLHEWQDYAARMLRQASPMQSQRPNKRGSHSELGDPGIVGAGEEMKQAFRFGDDLPSDVIVRLPPDQLFNIYMLLANARGVHPNEIDDTEIESLDADAYVDKIKEARKNIIELDKIEKDKIERGVIKKGNKSFNSAQWVQLFDITLEMKDMVDAMNATAAAEKADKKAEEAKNENANKEE